MSTNNDGNKRRRVKQILPSHISLLKGERITYKCNICNRIFKSRSNCCYHKHCDAQNKPHKCTLCDRSFSSKTHLGYHNLVHSGTSPYSCEKCNKSFKTKTKLRAHGEVHKDFEERKTFICDVCDKSFLRVTALNTHKLKHVYTNKFTCTTCNKSYTEKKNLQFHMSKHKNEKYWTCEKCGKSFSVKWNLELHKKTHNRLRLFSCSKCNQSFSQKRYLKRHLRSHGGNLPYNCHICEKLFSRKDNLQRHMVNSHIESQSTSKKINTIINNTENNKRSTVIKIVSKCKAAEKEQLRPTVIKSTKEYLDEQRQRSERMEIERKLDEEPIRNKLTTALSSLRSCIMSSEKRRDNKHSFIEDYVISDYSYGVILVKNSAKICNGQAVDNLLDLSVKSQD